MSKSCRRNVRVLVIASEAKQSRAKKEVWIASSPSAPRNDDADEWRVGWAKRSVPTIDQQVS
jgi:hypothetical protein